METLTCVCLGIGLSAACGFRVFVPLLFMSLASLSGHLTLAHSFAWIGTYPALITFAVATSLEIGGYYIPWVDHLLDTLATPAAVVAGTIVTAAIITDVSPLLKWTLAVIAGGGVAGVVQGSTVLARATSTATTGGLGNPLFATIELGGAVMTSIMALVAPIVLALLIMVTLWLVVKKLVHRKLRLAPAGPR
jgi:hypothetical protein